MLPYNVTVTMRIFKTFKLLVFLGEGMGFPKKKMEVFESPTGTKFAAECDCNGTSSRNVQNSEFYLKNGFSKKNFNLSKTPER